MVIQKIFWIGLSPLHVRETRDSFLNQNWPLLNNKTAQLAGVVEYTDCIYAEELDPPPANECPGYSIKQSDSEAPVMLALWEMQSTPSLPLLLGQLWPGVVAPNRVLSTGQIGLFDI